MVCWAAPAMLLVLPPPELTPAGSLAVGLLALLPPVAGARGSLAVLRAVRATERSMTLWRATPLGELARSLLAPAMWSAALGALQRSPDAWPIAALAALAACLVVGDVRAVHLDGGRRRVVFDGLVHRSMPLDALGLVASEMPIPGAPRGRARCWVFELRAEHAAPVLVGCTESRDVALQFLSDVHVRTGVRTALQRLGASAPSDLHVG
jgi:hypothetical protein